MSVVSCYNRATRF